MVTLARIVDVLAIQIRKSPDRQVTGFIDFDFAPKVTKAEPNQSPPLVLNHGGTERRRNAEEE